MSSAPIRSLEDTNDLECCSAWVRGQPCKTCSAWGATLHIGKMSGLQGPACVAHAAAQRFEAALCRLGCGTILTTHWGQHVWRLPLSARGAAAEALEAAQGVRCTVDDVHPVPRAYLEVGAFMCAACCAQSLVGRALQHLCWRMHTMLTFTSAVHCKMQTQQAKLRQTR